MSRGFKLYLEPLLQVKGPGGKYIRWTDIRLMGRRMLRDACPRLRPAPDAGTLALRPFLRDAQYHLVNQHTTDYIINTGMPYGCRFTPTVCLAFSPAGAEERLLR